MTLDAYLDLLDAPNTAILASVLPDGSVQASPVWFLHDNGRVLISTTVDRQKYRNLVRDPHVAFTLVDPAKPLRYLEVRGIVQITDEASMAVRDAIARKHGFDDGSAFDPPDARRVVLTIVPSRVIRTLIKGVTHEPAH